jgi:AraC-like DNA-binding protein
MRNLGLSIVPAFAAPDRASRLFVEHVTLAVGAHLAQTYGGMKVVPRSVQGGLAHWQEERAKEIISANLGGEISVALLAKECGLSSGHFSRAFRQSTGVAPHRWLLSRRVDAAQTMLRNRKHSLSEIALACGFADQSHFTRVFSGIVGVSPGVWRRQTVGADQ